MATAATDKKKTASLPSVALFIALFCVALSYWFVPSPNSRPTTGDGVRIDAPTGFAFADQQDFAVAGKKMTLLGVGVRKKAIINVYSVGFYGSKPVLKAVSSQESKCDAILSTKGNKAAHLTMNMGLNAEKMAEALSNVAGVAEDVKQAFGDMILNGIGGKLHKGESMTIEWKTPETVAVTARGDLLGEMKDKTLFQGLLQVYLGSKSVSPALKRDIEAFVAKE